MWKKLTLPGTFLAAGLLLLGAPDSRIEASECGGPGTNVCKENESCLSIIFYRHCTTTTDYWSTEDGGEEAPPTAPGQEEEEG